MEGALTTAPKVPSMHWVKRNIERAPNVTQASLILKGEKKHIITLDVIDRGALPN